MMITIHGLPPTAKYRDLKILIKQQCNISDFILDSLVSDVDGRNKVRVGLADDTEGSHVMKCLNGFRFRGNNLRLVPVGKTSSITQQPSSLDVRGSYQQSDYSNQDLQDRNKTTDATRQTNWANNQWASNKPQLAVQNNYDYQQPAVMPYGQPQTSTVVKPHFEQRDAIQSSRSQSQNYNYSAKSNLISLGPQNNILSTLHEIPQVPSQARQPLGRYTNQSYDMPSEKPITIMKDNFQGPNQYNITSSHNQSFYPSQGQISPWATQQPQQKPFEKPLPTFDKKPYDDRKYPFQAKHIQEPSKLDDSYKYERSGRGRSPQRKDFREMEERARAFKGAQYSDRRTPERRMSPSRNITSTGRHFSSGRETSPSGRHVLSTGRHASPTGRHLISTGGHDTPPSRHVQHTSRHPSPGRRGLQSSRDFSPGGHGSQTSRLVSPGRRGLPAGRISPQPGRHFPSGGRYGSPSDRHVAQSGRHISPPGRHVPPGGRHVSPPRPMPTERKMSPSRNLSPSRRDSPHLRKDEYIRGSRLSPPPHSQMDRRSIRQSSDRDSGRGMARYPSPHSMDQKQMPYQDGHRNAGIKDVRPAYEPQVQAPNEAMYSGGYHPNIHEEAIRYQSRSEHWKERENFSSKAVMEDRREGSRMQKFDIPRASERPRSSEQDANRSRSPKRDRSPIRDRFKRHSPSPRSPRRSWALEKRRSPEIREPPPPPVWPQEKEEYSAQVRPKFPEKEMEKNSPVWETREKIRDNFQSIDDRHNFQDQRRPEVAKWKPIPGSSPQPNPSSRFEEPTRKEFENRREFIRDDENRKIHTDRHDKKYHQEHSDMRFKSNFDTKIANPRKRDEFSGRIEEKKKEILFKQEQLQKEIDEVYKRAVDFTKKAEIYRKGGSQREGNYDEERGSSKEMQRFNRHPYDEDRHRENIPRDYKTPQYSRDDDRKKFHEDIKKSHHSFDNSQKSRYVGNKTKRARLVDDISDSIMSSHGKFLSGEIKKRITDELKWTLGRKLQEMFDGRDYTFPEMASMFNEKYTAKDQENIFKDVMFSLPNHYRNLKRLAQDEPDARAPTKSSRRSSESSANKDFNLKVKAEQKRPTDSREGVKKNAISEVQKNLGTETTKSTKNKVQKSAEDKGSEKTQENNSPPEEDDEQFQLNDQMSRILEEELNTIMIEVWQALPDDPPNEAEKFVVEKLRYEASDDLRNVLGLNVTKRLLDVYNPLIVKLHFSCRPEKGSLGKFLNAYNVKTVRHIGTDTNIVAARLTSISDFDKLCTNKDLRCGNAKVTVTPVYKFSKCPAKLNTIFNNNEEEENNVAYKDYNDGKAKDDTSEVGGSKNEATKANKQEINEKVINIKIENKDNPKQEPKSSNDEIKTSNQKIASDVEQLDNKKPKTTQKEKFTDNKETKKSEPDNKPKNENVKNITPQNKKIATNPKTAVSDKKETEKINKIISKIEKNIPTKKVAVEKEREFLDEEVMEDEIQEFDDGDEMNDDEILALISEGVVVDECIGSDRE